MARLRVKQIAETKGIKNPTELMRITGISYSLARELWKEVDLNLETRTLEQIAQKLDVRFIDLFDHNDSSSQPSSPVGH